jgi:hypothetical protein
MTMRRVIGLALALQALVVMGWARADEIEGRIKSVDKTQGVIALENGVKIWVAEGLSMDTLKEGALVRAAYEERDGEKVATSIEVKSAPRP